MEIKQFVWDVVNSNSWLIVENNKGILVDIIKSHDLYSEIADLDEIIVILTHSHFDHIVGLNQIRLINPNIKVIATIECSRNIGNKYRNMSASANAFMTFYSGKNYKIEPFTCKTAEFSFANKKEFCWGRHKVKLDAFHGHSNDSLVAIIDDRYMFSGDTILPIPTITRFPGGSTARFWEEDIPKLQNINVEIVFPGHGTSGKLGDMIEINKRPEKYKRGTR